MGAFPSRPSAARSCRHSRSHSALKSKLQIRIAENVLYQCVQLTLSIAVHSDAGTDEVKEEGAAEKADQADVETLRVRALESIEAAEVGAGLVAEYRRVCGE